MRAADLAFLPFGILYLIYALAPETTADAITYHLGIPAEWLRARGPSGRAGFFDFIPHALELLFAPAIAIGGFTAAKLVHFAFLVATLPLAIAVGRLLGFDARPAALLYFAAPVVGMSGTAAYNDAAVVFAALAAFYLLLTGDLTRAGLASGLCYGIKMSGGVVTLAAGAYLLWRRAWPGLAWMAAMVAPWLGWSWWLSGNPVAPMLLDVFPSPVIYPATVQGWNEYVRSYGVPWSERFWEATMLGARSQGLLGPGFLAAPLALLALRRRTGALLLGAAAITGSAWLLNAGTRFLMPSALFVALALASSLPRPAMWGLALVQGVLCWPAVMDRYATPGAWRLRSEWPWRAALRIEPEAEYLRRVSPEFGLAELINKHVPPSERVLDLVEAPRAYTIPTALASWQYTSARRAEEALVTAASGEPRLLYSLRGAWPQVRLRSIRFEQFSTSPDQWSIQEARLLRGGEALFPSREWTLDARPNPWDAPLAFDRNAASGWRTWEPRRDGMHLEIAGAVEVDGVELICRRQEAGPRVSVTGVDERGAPVLLAHRLEPATNGPALNLRSAAVRYVRREGFQWILAGTANKDQVGPVLADQAADWGLERAGHAGSVVLLRIKAE